MAAEVRGACAPGTDIVGDDAGSGAYVPRKRTSPDGSQRFGGEQSPARKALQKYRSEVRRLRMEMEGAGKQPAEPG